ncbi:MAG TPA: hypothetical protein VK656_04840, partial [Candidatus Acidoferrum sp.]|nr:hypothetical protein [Candidatus Acidoferrum sp.]
MTDDEQLETRLRDVLAARDPGLPAPRELHDRVAEVPRADLPGSPIQAMALRAVAAVMATAAAVVVGILGVAALRNVGRPLVLPSPGSGGASTSSPDLHFAGFVVAFPIVLVIGLALIVVGAIAVVLEPTSFSVPVLVARPPRGF